MSDRNNILTELTSISPTVAELPFKPVFTVPERYFTEFPDKLIKMIREEQDSDVKSELEQLSPLLASLDRKTPFSIPEGYFSQFEHDLQPGKVQAPAKVVQMFQPGKLRILYAATVTAILGFFTWFYIINNNNNQPLNLSVNINSELPKVSETEISSYLATTPENIQTDSFSLAGVEEADFDEIMDKINESELQQFINENPVLQNENMN